MYAFLHLNEMFELCFTFIPQHILLAKLVRPGTESTMMGLSYAMLLLNHNVLRDMVGAFINEEFFHVDKDNLENYWKCIAVSTSCCLIPLTYIYFLVPSNEACDKVEQMYSQVKSKDVDRDDLDKDEDGETDKGLSQELLPKSDKVDD